MSTRVDVHEARALISEGAQLVDVLTERIYRLEHLPGAVSVPLESFDAESINDHLDAGRAVVVYCFDQH